MYLYIPRELGSILTAIFKESYINDDSVFNEEIIKIICDLLGANPPNQEGSIVALPLDEKSKKLISILNIPEGNDFVAIACGIWICVALKKNGSLVAWFNDQTIYMPFIQIPGDINELLDVPKGNDFVAVSCGWGHALALRRDGSLATWGWDVHPVPKGNDFVDIACRGDISMALKRDGSIKIWGMPIYNEIEECPRENNFVAISANIEGCYAHRDDGSIVAWGYEEIPMGERYPASEEDLVNDTVCGISIWDDDFNTMQENIIADNYKNILDSIVKQHDLISLSTGYPIMALKNDGTILVGQCNDDLTVDCKENGFIDINSYSNSYIALKEDGSIKTWTIKDGKTIIKTIENNFIAIAVDMNYFLALQKK